MKFTRNELYILWNSVDQRKQNLEYDYTSDREEYQILLNKLDILLNQRRDIQVIDRVWED